MKAITEKTTASTTIVLDTDAMSPQEITFYTAKAEKEIAERSAEARNLVNLYSNLCEGMEIFLRIHVELFRDGFMKETISWSS